MEKASITAALVARLVGAQFPQWAHLPIAPVELDGWDNTTFRLGDELSVRLPSGDGYVAQVDKEHRWLQFLAPQLPLSIPEPLARGRPGQGFPRPWSVYRWLVGEPASVASITDVSQLATDLAAFLVALRAIDPAGGPPPGAHNSFRGGPLRTYDAQTVESIALLDGEIDTVSAAEVWEAGLAHRWDRSPVWIHGDVTASNLLVTDGRLGAVIDFGCAAVGDPACDLVMAWTYFAGASRTAFRLGLDLDDATWARGRCWALWKALITLVEHGAGSSNSHAAARRFGWGIGARSVVEEVIADHRRST